jgi:DNA mismatch repair protein MutS
LFDLGDPAPASPVDDQIATVRECHPGMVLLFHVADRYQLFDDDAILATDLLELELCQQPRSTCSFPAQSLEAHLRKLLHSGHRVAICDLVE